MSNPQCDRGYHDYEQKEVNPRQIISKCKLCGKVIQESPTDNVAYIKNHKRDFLQRGHKDYKFIYGENKPFEKEIDKKWEEDIKEDKKKERDKDIRKSQF